MRNAISSARANCPSNAFSRSSNIVIAAISPGSGTTQRSARWRRTMTNAPLTAGTHSGTHDHRATPLTGVMIGTGISLFLWAMILAVVFAVR
ncbi:hypothetical protein WR25_13935 [Diploscapter pachys]|uniref:Uncharacterized protein n=1 Tax=Diploscapter pachys TaxID=2018661 RepID=A0A2A2K0A1_9BILA|nr:hypothetical protein WR25_13935 [Diploscapter pachys]